MKVKSNLEQIFWVTILTTIIVALIGGALYLFGDILFEVRTYLGWILVLLILIFGGMLLNILNPQDGRVQRFSNTPIESPSGAKWVAYGRYRGKIFTNAIKMLFSDSNEDKTRGILSVMLPNGRLIGSDRLKDVIFLMGLDGNTTRARWVGRGDMTLSRTEWEGVISFLDRWGLLEKVDGRGNAHLRDIDNETWWDEVDYIVKRSSQR